MLVTVKQESRSSSEAFSFIDEVKHAWQNVTAESDKVSRYLNCRRSRDVAAVAPWALVLMALGTMDENIVCWDCHHQALSSPPIMG